jgi:hypothetical protein
MRWMFFHELANLGIVLVILAGPYLLVRATRTRLWPSVIALLYMILAIIASGFVYHEGQGYGPYVMITLIYFPVLLLYGWIVAKLSFWWLRRKAAKHPANRGPVLQFGRTRET